MSPYTHLTQDQRYQISALLKAKTSQSKIAEILAVNKSTVSREIWRNFGKFSYAPALAQRLAIDRRRDKAPLKISNQTRDIVEQKIRELQWSPEQIAGWLKKEGGQTVSHEWIYQRVARDKQQGGTLHKHLRHGKKRRAKYGSYARKGPIANRVGIEMRPPEALDRDQIGHWELDTIVGKGPAAIVTAVERASRFTLMARINRKGAAELQAALCQMLLPFADKVGTLTSDNGAEFARHAQISLSLKAEFFFANPYAAWERGTNENTNGLIRQYFKKGLDLSIPSENEINTVAEKLNARPRKTLGFKNPNQVIFPEITVALRG